MKTNHLQDELLFQEIILKHLNAPEDENLTNQVAAIRAVSGEHEKFYQDVKYIWDASAETNILHQVDLKHSIINFKAQLSNGDKYATKKWFSFPRLAAAAVLFCASGISAYHESSEVVYL